MTTSHSLEPDTGNGNRPKHEVLAEVLALEFQRLEAGTPIPAVRSLIDRFGLSQGTVTHALRNLRARGLVARPPGRKRLVTVGSRAPREAVLRVLFLRPQWSSPDYDMIGNALLEEASRMNLHVEALHYGSRWHDHLANAVRSHDALIVLPSSEGDAFLQPLIEESRTPAVMLWDEASAPGIMSVAEDDFAVGRLATEHLLELGHGRVVAFQSEPALPVMRRRLAGWELAVRAAGERHPERLLIDCSVEPGMDAIVGSYEKLRRWLHRNGNRLPATAVFCLCWTGAIGMLRALREIGIEVPRDVSILTDAGQNRLCEFTNPALSVIHTKAADFASSALALLKEVCLGNSPAQRNILLQPTIVERESTRRIAEYSQQTI